MNLLTIILTLPVLPKKRDTIIKLPRLYALSKNGSIRVYDIIVEDFEDHASLTTRKKSTLKGKWTEDKYWYWTGVNIGKANETTYIEQALSEAHSMWKRLVDGGFTTEIPTGLKFNTDANGNIKPMLAISFNEKRVKFPCIAQYKYDGVRCMIVKDSDGVKLISRKGKLYNIPHLQEWAEKHTELLPLDGELYNHKDLTFQEIISAVKKHSKITSQIKMVVYDLPLAGLSNKERIEKLHLMFSSMEKDAPLYEAPYVILHDMDELRAFHKKSVDSGYEGIIIRNSEGTYEFGFQSNDLIKYKTFNDDEFEIVDVIEASGRDALTAIFVCKCEGGYFNVKPQGSKELRHEYWINRHNLIGKLCTVQYQGLSDDGIPRFPSAVSVRDYE